MEGLHDSGKWETTGYNTGAFPHAVFVRFHASPVKAATAWPKPSLLALNALTSAADLTALPPDAFQSDAPIVPQPYYQAPM